MSRQKLDYVKIREFSDTGATVTKIAGNDGHHSRGCVEGV